MDGYTFYLDVDWQRDGNYTTEDATRVKSFIVRRGRRASVTGEGYEPVKTGELTVALGNDDNRYGLFNTSSPIYNSLRPNRPLRLRYSAGTNTGYIFTGLLRNIVNQPAKRLAQIEALDGIDYLSKRNGDDIGLQSNYGVSDALLAILQAANYPFADTTGWTFPMTFPTTLSSTAIIDNGDTIPYFWGQTEKSAWEQLLEVAHAFAGDVYIAADGVFSYKSRDTAETPSLTLRDDDVLAGVQPEQPWDEIRNYVKVTARPLTATAANVDIWQMYDRPLIEPGKSITVWADYQYDTEYGPATSVTTPVATTDYTANTAQDGSGSNRTASLGVAFTQYTTRAKIVLTNNGVDNLYVTFFRIRGTMLTAPNDASAIEEDAASIGEYEKRALRIDSPFMQEQKVAAYHASYAKTQFASPRKVVWARILNRPALQLALDLFDVVRLELTAIGADGNYRLTYIEHDFQPGRFQTTWRLEPIISGFWTFPMTFGENNVFGW